VSYEIHLNSVGLQFQTIVACEVVIINVAGDTVQNKHNMLAFAYV